MAKLGGEVCKQTWQSGKTEGTDYQLLNQKDAIAARRHIQAMYNSNQKLWNKKMVKGVTNNG